MFFLFLFWEKEEERERELVTCPARILLRSLEAFCSVRSFRLTLRQLPAALNAAKTDFLSLANKRSKHITTTNRLAIHTKYFQLKTDSPSVVDNPDKPMIEGEHHSMGLKFTPRVDRCQTFTRGEILLELINDVSVCASELFSKCTNDRIKALCMTNTEARWMRLVNTSTASKQKHETNSRRKENRKKRVRGAKADLGNGA